LDEGRIADRDLKAGLARPHAHHHVGVRAAVNVAAFGVGGDEHDTVGDAHPVLAVLVLHVPAVIAGEPGIDGQPLHHACSNSTCAARILIVRPGASMVMSCLARNRVASGVISSVSPAPDSKRISFSQPSSVSFAPDGDSRTKARGPSGERSPGAVLDPY